MRHLLLFIVLCTVHNFSTKSQENGDYHTVFSGGIHRISGFGGPMYNYTIVNNSFTLLSGGGGGILLNDFFLGGFGMSNSTGINYVNNVELSVSYGGLLFGYSFRSNNAIHPAISIQTGWGKIKAPAYSQFENNYLINDRIFVVVPELDLELNLARFFRISLGLNYRIIGGLDANSLSFFKASGIGVNVMFKFGWF